MKKILIIDDSTFSRNQIKRFLGDGYSYLEAVDGMQGMELFFLERPELVILDLTMPGMNGLEVLNKLKQVDSNARVVIGTADIQDYSRLEADRLGSAGFIIKPFVSTQVQEVVKAVLKETEA